MNESMKKLADAMAALSALAETPKKSDNIALIRAAVEKRAKQSASMRLMPTLADLDDLPDYA